jgi:pyruvate/2-oxoglutarate dehydrogenase complex dihydrolipoamide acyltransferase (E2) component
MINRAFLATAAVGAALLTGACGSDDDNSAGGGPRAKGDLQAAALKFARCMRDHGIDIPDPKGGGADGQVIIGGPGAKGKFDPQSPVFKTAEKSCKKYMDAARPELTPAQEQEAQERTLEMLRCMRQHGVNLPDAAADGPGLKIGPESGVNPRDPAFQRAQKACMKGRGGVFSSRGPGQ